MISRRVTFRPVSAAEALEAAREAEMLTTGGDAGLIRNACLLARAVRRGRRRVWASGGEVLEALSAETVACWTRTYAALRRAEIDRLKNDDEGRLRWAVLRAFGIAPWEKRAKKMTPDDLRACVLQMTLDDEAQLADVCPRCREDLLRRRCPVCGEVRFEENPNFDPEKFEELRNRGLSDVAADQQ